MKEMLGKKVIIHITILVQGELGAKQYCGTLKKVQGNMIELIDATERIVASSLRKKQVPLKWFNTNNIRFESIEPI